ncbi:hypothetical protein BRDID11002_15220 [Bradyrhizobium diazoefficiens]
MLPWATVEENVEFPLLHAQLSAAQRRALVEGCARAATGLTDFRKTYPKQLSGGMRQRRRDFAGAGGQALPSC